MLQVDPRYLYSIRAQSSYTWQKMVCELIDNSFDAKADSVKISFPGGKVFSIEDNGVGCHDLSLMLNLGNRFELESNDIGKYGVGCKLALIWLWGRTEVKTRHKELSRSVEVNWENVANGKDDFPPAIYSSGKLTPGTLIKCFSERAYPKNLNSLRENIASTYTPAIDNGCKIFWFVNGPSYRLIGRKWPQCESEDYQTVIAAGREVSVRMGIVKEGVFNPYQKGFSFERTHRVIMESALGSGEYSVSRIAARISLGKEWDLSTNKDELLEFRDELEEAIYSQFEGMIREASEQAVSFEDQEFNRELASIIQESTKAGQREERPNPGESKGTVEPKETGRKRENATSASDKNGSVIGEYGINKRRSGFSVETYFDDSLTFGYYDRPANKVRLNLSNEWIAKKHREKNMDAIIPVVYGLLADFAIRNEANSIPLFKSLLPTFGEQWGSSVASTVDCEVSR